MIFEKGMYATFCEMVDEVEITCDDIRYDAVGGLSGTGSRELGHQSNLSLAGACLLVHEAQPVAESSYLFW